MKTVFFVIVDSVKGNANWDTFHGAYASYEEADTAACMYWDHLTYREQRDRTVEVIHADVEDDVAIEDAYDIACVDGWYTDKAYKAGLWYAVMRDIVDDDWGYGSYDKAEAIEMARECRNDGNPDAYIAVIDEGYSPVCVGEIHDID